MKKVFIVLLFIGLVSCKKESKIEREIEKIPVVFKVERFDKIFYESQPSDLKQI